MNDFWILVHESVRALAGRRLPGVVTALVSAAAIATVLLSTGTASGARRDVSHAVDALSSRTLTFRALPGAAIDSSVVGRLGSLDDVEWIGALGPSQDVQNEAVRGGPVVSVRSLWTSDLRPLGIPADRFEGSVWITRESSTRLGLADHVGTVASKESHLFAVVGTWSPPAFLREEGVDGVQPRPAAHAGAVSSLVVVAEDSSLVAALVPEVIALLGVSDTGLVKVERGIDLSGLRHGVEGRLAAFGGELTLLTFGSAGAIVGIVLSALIVLRRKEFGRRRALGATRPAVILLVEVQIGLAAVAGVTVGTVGALVILVGAGQPLPALDFCLAAGWAVVATALVAGLAPALIAATRQPALELRTP